MVEMVSPMVALHHLGDGVLVITRWRMRRCHTKYGPISTWGENQRSTT